jgi:endonuclease G
MKKYIIALTLFASTAFASDCPQFYPNNTPIEVPGTIELCSDFFVVRYDPTKKAAVLASEIVSAKHISIERKDTFRPDERVEKGQRAELADYKKSGYDKGHLVPAGDAGSVEQMHSTFRLTNMTPQDPDLNRGAWRELEYTFRGKVMRGGVDVWVVTGASYADNSVTIGKNAIPVPTGYYKIGYFVGGTRAFYAHNSGPGVIIGSTVKDINLFTGLTLPE